MDVNNTQSQDLMEIRSLYQIVELRLYHVKKATAEHKKLITRQITQFSLLIVVRNTMRNNNS